MKSTEVEFGVGAGVKRGRRQVEPKDGQSLERGLLQMPRRNAERCQGPPHQQANAMQVPRGWGL